MYTKIPQDRIPAGAGCYAGGAFFILCSAETARPRPRGFFIFTLFFFPLLRTCLQCKRFGPHFLGLSFGKRRQGRLRICGCAFLSSLRLHLFCVPRLTASCLCPFLLFTKRRKPQRGKEGKGCPCLKVFCAPADAQPLTLAIIIVWRCHCRFHSVRLNGEKAEKLLKRPVMPRRTNSDSSKLHKPPV